MDTVAEYRVKPTITPQFLAELVPQTTKTTTPQINPKRKSLKLGNRKAWP